MFPVKVMIVMFLFRSISQSLRDSKSSVTRVGSSDSKDYYNPRMEPTYDEVYGPPGDNEETIDDRISRLIKKRTKGDQSAQPETATFPGK